ncbi:Oidioi.mRNA.OKI2018_I69.chr2.g5445.t1.cds [Oikopleura dioica]|uniref:Oidioi.mRNA.OKI2018_I69.chr2.g5445.t1.cds n=1 Tax=Oikopleura dioica TaxID=34765 RepID=A0ABN7T4R1_OIKDI|nr:Oidioi.mRNA.OKI2018_I69.chr2.g5445.t1.cds [Oikopleura dioica]
MRKFSNGSLRNARLRNLKSSFRNTANRIPKYSTYLRARLLTENKNRGPPRMRNYPKTTLRSFQNQRPVPTRPALPPAQRANIPGPTVYKGPEPKWTFTWQKGDFCYGNTGAALPCQEPIRNGSMCKKKLPWSDRGWTEVEIYCLRNPNYPKLSIRKEKIKQCFYQDGLYECWEHWSTNHLLEDFNYSS